MTSKSSWTPPHILKPVRKVIKHFFGGFFPPISGSLLFLQFSLVKVKITAPSSHVKDNSLQREKKWNKLCSFVYNDHLCSCFGIAPGNNAASLGKYCIRPFIRRLVFGVYKSTFSLFTVTSLTCILCLSFPIRHFYPRGKDLFRYIWHKWVGMAPKVLSTIIMSFFFLSLPVCREQ